MTKQQIKMLTSKQLEKLSLKWLMIIASKPKQFGKASDRALEEIKARRINFVR